MKKTKQTNKFYLICINSYLKIFFLHTFGTSIFIFIRVVGNQRCNDLSNFMNLTSENHTFAVFFFLIKVMEVDKTKEKAGVIDIETVPIRADHVQTNRMNLTFNGIVRSVP